LQPPQGSGAPIFASLREHIGLSLMDERRFGSGTVLLHYEASRGDA